MQSSVASFHIQIIVFNFFIFLLLLLLFFAFPHFCLSLFILNHIDKYIYTTFNDRNTVSLYCCYYVDSLMLIFGIFKKQHVSYCIVLPKKFLNTSSVELLENHKERKGKKRKKKKFIKA